MVQAGVVAALQEAPFSQGAIHIRSYGLIVVRLSNHAATVCSGHQAAGQLSIAERQLQLQADADQLSLTGRSRPKAEARWLHQPALPKDRYRQ